MKYITGSEPVYKKSQVMLDLEDDLFSSLAAEIQKEIDKSIMTAVTLEMYKRMNWHLVKVKSTDPAIERWCEAHIKGKYDTSENVWFFESLNDANFFTLRWSSHI